MNAWRRGEPTAAGGRSCQGRCYVEPRASDGKVSLRHGRCSCAELKARGARMRLKEQDARVCRRSGFRHSVRTAVPDAIRWASFRCGVRTAVPDESRWASLRRDVRKKAPGGSRCRSLSRTSANCCRWDGSRTSCCYLAAMVTSANCCLRMRSEKNRKGASRMNATHRKMMSVSLNDGRLRKNG